MITSPVCALKCRSPVPVLNNLSREGVCDCKSVIIVLQFRYLYSIFFIYFLSNTQHYKYMQLAQSSTHARISHTYRRVRARIQNAHRHAVQLTYTKSEIILK